MSLQTSTFNTTHVMENEIVKSNDFEYAFESLVNNVAKVSQMILESRQDFVINGKVLPYQGMNVQISPIFGICKATGIPFGRTETAVMDFGFAESESGRIDIIEVQGVWETYDNQQRAFNDPDTDTQTYQYVDTKKLTKPVYRIKQGEEGSNVAPELDTGWVKLAEVAIRANNSEITEDDIKNITSDIAGEENSEWSLEKTATYNIGYISDVNERFREQHNSDGTHKNDVINTDSLNIGTGVKQINANVLPIGGVVTIPNEQISSTDSILSVINKIVVIITSLYNAYLKTGVYGFKGIFSVSSIADANNILTKPIQIIAAGDGTAVIKVDDSAVLSIDANGKLSTNGYIPSSANHIVTKTVTDAITTALNALTQRVAALENTSDQSVYSNGVISSGTDGRYNVDQTVIYAATTENITLSGTQTIDGTTPADGSFIFVKNQTDAKENGIYAYSSSSLWQRVTDFSNISAFIGKIFNITNGTQNGGKMFYMARQVFPPEATIDNVELNFIEYFGSVKPLGNKLAARDSQGHVKTSNPSSATDAVNKGALLDLIYPVGSLYWTSKAPNNNGDPNSLFGGSWTQIKDQFVWAMGDNDTVNTTHGNATVTLSKANMPKHYHNVSIGQKEATFDNNATTGNVSGSGATWNHGHPIGGASELAGGGRCTIAAINSGVTTYTNEVDLQHTHSLAGIKVKVDIGSPNTDEQGSGTAFSIMPPYICKYCWERTA